jgi:phosphatidylinositol-4,5-bisphosphate 3-kinase
VEIANGVSKLNKEARTNTLRQLVEQYQKEKLLADRHQLSSEEKKKEKIKTFILPLSPEFEAKSIITKKCRVMDSKKKPLWITFSDLTLKELEKTESLPSSSIMMVLFKLGDDIRQDQLTLQIMRVMNLLWLREGLDMRMNIYRTQSTGDYQGFIEVVKDSQTLAHINKQIGGGATAAFDNTTLYKWLEKAAENGSSIKFQKIQENFVYSCAGYCVATFVMGIGDRHNDNVMCQTDGHFFHIDFGHFLGNFKKKFGIEREKAPFIFTPALYFVLGNDHSAPWYKLFESLCCKAYNILRKHSHIIINLFLMVCVGSFFLSFFIIIFRCFPRAFQNLHKKKMYITYGINLI